MLEFSSSLCITLDSFWRACEWNYIPLLIRHEYASHDPNVNPIILLSDPVDLSNFLVFGPFSTSPGWRIFSTQTFLGTPGCLRIQPDASDLSLLPILLPSFGWLDNALVRLRRDSGWHHIPFRWSKGRVGLPRASCSLAVHPMVTVAHDLLGPWVVDYSPHFFSLLLSYFSTFLGLASFFILNTMHLGVPKDALKRLKSSYIAHFFFPLARFAPPSLVSKRPPDGITFPFHGANVWLYMLIVII